jgi:hypothetical protein
MKTRQSYTRKVRRLRALRCRSGIPLQLVAVQLGKTRAWLNQIELVKFRTTDQVLEKIEQSITEAARAVRTQAQFNHCPIEKDLRLPRRSPSRSRQSR